MADAGVPVLTYHSIDTSGSVISVDPAVFASQMRLLSARGFTGIRADELIAAWNGGAPLPARPVVITFDDGFENFSEIVAPLLRELNFRATVFVIADLAGMTNDWAGQPPQIPRLPLMSWEQIRGIAAHGFEIGGHTSTHPDLRTISGAALEREIGASKAKIEQNAGTAVTTFAYPYGAVSREAAAIAARHYSASFGTELGPASAGMNHHDIRRIDMYYLRDPWAFRMFGSAAGNAYLAFRGLGRAVRGILGG